MVNANQQEGQSRSDSSETVPDTQSAVASGQAETTVEIRCTGHVRTEVGEGKMDYTFEGERLRDLLSSFFEQYDVEEMLIAETEDEATTDGWAPQVAELPGERYAKNPEGEQTRCYARVTVNGTFNELLDGLDTPVEDGDRIGLIYPFMYCC